MAVLANLLQVETFPLHTTFIAVSFFLIPLPYRCHYVVSNMCIYTYVHISDCVQAVYELQLKTNSTASEMCFHNMEQCEGLAGYLSLCAGLEVVGQICTL